jgi:hypothetical protein
MLGKLVLILLQIAIGYLATPKLTALIPVPGVFALFLFAVVAAIVIYVTGILGALVLKDVGTPSPATLTSAVIFALIGAAIATWGPQFLPQVPWGRVPASYIVLGAAILGYTIKK